MRATHASRQASGWMDLDLTLGQIRFLHILNRAGSMSIGQVAELLGVTPTTASQFVDRLETHGHVERTHRDDDRRVVECRLTKGGSEICSAMRGMQRESFAALLGNLKPRELKVLERLYRLMLERATAETAPSAAKRPASPKPALRTIAPLPAAGRA